MDAWTEFIEPILVKSLRRDLPLEAQRRIEQILARLESRPLAPEQLQMLRAIAVLEYRATPQALAVLRRLAAGAVEAHVTREAIAARERLQKR